MAVDAFLQFKGGGAAGHDIEGETYDKTMRNMKPLPFDIQNWNFGITQDVNIGSASGGIGAGKVNFNPFKITKAIDKSSPLFFGTLCTGGHYEDVILYMRKAGTSKERSSSPDADVYLKYEFKMAFVTNISWSHNDPAPNEEITFEYGALQVTYKPQKKDGSLGASKTTAWSRVLNKNVLGVE
jgi:type VI secretion system secreted protein Hcp